MYFGGIFFLQTLHSPLTIAFIHSSVSHNSHQAPHCKVRFVYECFRTLQPGVPLMALHGKHKQARRTFT